MIARAAGLLALFVAAPAVAQVRVEPRALVKESRLFVSGGLSWLDRRDYYDTYGANVSASYYLRENDAAELRAAIFLARLTDAGRQVIGDSVLLPDTHKPVALILGGWRHSLAYGKVAVGSGVVHFDVQSGVHIGTLITDRAVEPALSGSVGLVARLGQRAFSQLDLAVLGSLESRSTTVFAVGFLPLLTFGISL